MSRHAAAIAAIVVSGLVAAAWTARVQSQTGGRTVIRFAYVGAPDDARHVSALRFKERVERESGGELLVELYPGGQLGGDRDAIEGVRLGTIEMTVAGAGLFANFEPGFGITALPYLVENFEEAWAFNDGPVNAAVHRRLLDRDMRVLCCWDNGFRCVTNSVRPIESPADMRGLAIRSPENPLLLATIRALGASPSPLPWPEIYMALQQGAFDGQENPVPTIYVSKLYEVQTYLSLTNHSYEPMPVVVNEPFWRSLTAKQQAILRDAAIESQAFNRELVRRRSDEMVELLQRAGMMVSRPPLDPFKAATRRVYSQVGRSIGPDLVEAAVAFVEEYRKTQGERISAGERE